MDKVKKEQEDDATPHRSVSSNDNGVSADAGNSAQDQPTSGDVVGTIMHSLVDKQLNRAPVELQTKLQKTFAALVGDTRNAAIKWRTIFETYAQASSDSEGEGRAPADMTGINGKVLLGVGALKRVAGTAKRMDTALTRAGADECEAFGVKMQSGVYLLMSTVSVFFSYVAIGPAGMTKCSALVQSMLEGIVTAANNADIIADEDGISILQVAQLAIEFMSEQSDVVSSVYEEGSTSCGLSEFKEFCAALNALL